SLWRDEAFMSDKPESEAQAAATPQIRVTSESPSVRPFFPQEQHYATTLNSIGDAVIVTDLEGRVVFVNPVAERLTGWKREEAQGRSLEHVFVIVNEGTRAEVETPVGRVLREGGIVGLANHTLLI